MAVSRLVEELLLDSEDVRETGKKLGTGSYGAVVEVEYLGKLCAAKRIHWVWKEWGGKPGEEFKRECEIWSRLRHPNVVQLLGLLYEMSSDPWPATALPAIVMEKMDCTLYEFVVRRPREEIPLAVKIDVLYQAAQGLAYLHGQRPPVVHRDLTPNNILIKIDSMTAKLSDIGVARVLRQQTSSAGGSTGTGILGAVTFMSPEALSSTKITHPDRIDVFSFGCIIICVVTHQWPSPSSQIKQEQGKLVVRTEVERREHFLSQCDSEEQNCFLDVIHKCLQYEPLERPKSMHLVKNMTELKDTYPLKSYIELLKEVQGQPRDGSSQLSAPKEKDSVEHWQLQASNMELTKKVKELQQTSQSLERELSEKQQSLESKQREVEALSAKLSSCQAVVTNQHTKMCIPGNMGSQPHSQTVAPFSVTVFLEKHEDDFFKYVNPKQSLRRLKRKGVITEDVKSSIERSNTEDALEDLYEHLKFRGNLHTLKEFCKMAIDAEGLPNMQVLGRKMMEELPTEECAGAGCDP